MPRIDERHVVVAVRRKIATSQGVVDGYCCALHQRSGSVEQRGSEQRAGHEISASTGRLVQRRALGLGWLTQRAHDGFWVCDYDVAAP